MNFNFSTLSGNVIASVINANYDKVYGVIRDTYLAHYSQKTINPNSYFLQFPDKKNARIIALPSALKGQNSVSGIKWIASYPDNVLLGFPRASAVIILNDYETGYPFACLEGSIISATRTACSAVLAAESLHLTPKECVCLGFIGNGLIARYIYKYFNARNWKIGKIVLFDEQINSTKKLHNYIRKSFSGKIEIVTSNSELIKQSEIIVLATTASTPYLHDPNLFNKNQTVLNISLRDLAPDILINANNVVDDIGHILTANTSPDLTYRKYQTNRFINGTLGDFLVNGFKIDRQKPTVFSPMGLGILDITLSYFIYQISQKNNKLNVVDNFFYDLER